jgi:hypothetical protein
MIANPLSWLVVSFSSGLSSSVRGSRADGGVLPSRTKSLSYDRLGSGELFESLILLMEPDDGDAKGTRWKKKERTLLVVLLGLVFISAPL